MRVLITGAAGMLGRKLTARLIGHPVLDGRPITAIDLADRDAVDTGGQGGPASGPTIRSIAVDVTDGPSVTTLVADQPDVVFHLAAIVSGEAERDLRTGYRVNLDGTRVVFDALAALTTTPRVVFASSIAVFGGPLPDPIPDDHHLTPETSYGTQKAMGEALLADYSRRGLIDGVGIRLPTITVRPGAPNAAASGFFSGIIREPLAGLPAPLPVPTTVRHPHASPRAAVGFLVRAAELDRGDLERQPNLTMPSVSVTVGEQIEALTRVAGPEVAELIEDRPDPEVAAIVATWPRRFTADRARALGFRAEESYDEIIEVYLDDDAPPRP